MEAGAFRCCRIALSRMMLRMKRALIRPARLRRRFQHRPENFLAGRAAAWALCLGALALGGPSLQAQVNYVARFKMEKASYALGEPVFCDFVIHNTGKETILFSYRFPTRASNRDLPQEPNFTIKDSAGRAPQDPAPHPCGGAKGSVVYGSVTLPPGTTHTERWLLDQWAEFRRPGKYHLHAERRLPLKSVNGTTNEVSPQPVAYALALDNLTFEITPSTPAQRRAAFAPYARLLSTPQAKGFAEAFLVATTLPQAFLLPRLAELASAGPEEHRWERDDALEGLARLGTHAAWDAILAVARNSKLDDSLRAYAILLLGERADPQQLPAMIHMLSTVPASLRDDVLRALGFFHSPRANQVLFDQLHSSDANDRVNAILGLRNLESKDAVPALLAMLDDPDDQVRQVANFALESLTGERSVETRRRGVSTSPKEQSPAALAKRWHDWWLKHEATFEPVRQPACHDW
jgi:HEAT repeats